MSAVAGERKDATCPGQNRAKPQVPALRAAWNTTSQISGEPLRSVKPPHLPKRHQSINSIQQQFEQQGTARHAAGDSRFMQASGEAQTQGDNRNTKKCPGTTSREKE